MQMQQKQATLQPVWLVLKETGCLFCILQNIWPVFKYYLALTSNSSNVSFISVCP